MTTNPTHDSPNIDEDARSNLEAALEREHMERLRSSVEIREDLLDITKMFEARIESHERCLNLMFWLNLLYAVVLGALVFMQIWPT